MHTVSSLFDLKHTMAGAYLEGFSYPWEALDGITGLITRLGESLGDSYEEVKILPMGNLHEEFGQTVRIRGNYEKQVKVRGHLRPLTKNTGQQS